MEALLSAWLGGAEAVPILDDASVSAAREHVRQRGQELGLGDDVVEPAVLVASELARNQLKYARGGGILARPASRDGVPGLEIVAADRGPGLADPTAALEGVAKVAGSLGVGLASVREKAHEVDIDIRVGEGMCVWARLFAGEVRRRREVGIYGRPIAGERENGDGAAFCRDGESVTFAVCDGLGHGAPAVEASRAAMKTFAERAGASPMEIIEATHAALTKGRGAVMAVGRLDEDLGALSLASVGNILTSVSAPRASRRFGSASFVLGSPQRLKAQAETAPVGPREIVVMVTDGIRSQFSIEQELELLHRPSIVIAHQIVERFARGGDDVLALVVR